MTRIPGPSRPAHGAPPPAYLLKAATLMEAGKFAEAKNLLLISAKKGAPARALLLLALACESLGEKEPAAYHLSRAHAADPADQEVVLQYADLLVARSRQEDAIKVIDAYHASQPKSDSLLMLRSAILTRLGRPAEALADAETGLALMPASPDLLSAKGIALLALGRFDEAITTFRAADVPARGYAAYEEANDAHGMVDEARIDAERRLPKEPSARSSLAFALNYDDRASAEAVFQAHRSFGALVASRLKPMPPPTCSRDPERRLRVGFVSPDLRQHAVVSFLRPLLKGYDKREWDVTCYSHSTFEDAVSAELRSLVERWRFTPDISEASLAEQIRKDGIDVLIDLAALTRWNKIGAFAYKPAPVQITYLGYPNTTGLSTMDHRIVDALTDPPGHERYATEKLLRIDPCFLCFTPLVGAPDSTPRPPLSQRPIALGSFNLPLKMSDTNFRLWARVMRELPDATILFKHPKLDGGWVHEKVTQRMRSAGMDISRVRIVPPTKGYKEHLATYDQIDIALDTFPYHGTTTTCEALWMGVPVITLAGDRHASRVGCSLLSAVGLPELVAQNEDDYVRIVSDLARDHARLTALRSPGDGGLRARMLASPLCDAPAFCARFQTAVRQAWRDWCTSHT